MVKEKKNRLPRTQALIELGVMFAVVIILNLLAGQYYTRVDLTAEKRYTLTETSRKLCGQLKDRVYVKLYLEGEMSSKFKRFRNELRDALYEFREASARRERQQGKEPDPGAV
jgi:ABC-2 type transport system permease protein